MVAPGKVLPGQNPTLRVPFGPTWIPTGASFGSKSSPVGGGIEAHGE